MRRGPNFDCGPGFADRCFIASLCIVIVLKWFANTHRGLHIMYNDIIFTKSIAVSVNNYCHWRLASFICAERWLVLVELMVTNWHLSQTELCHKLTFVTNWPLSQTELCHKLSSVTNWALSQTDLCHKLTFVTNWPLSQTDLCHKLSSVTNWPLSQTYLCHKLTFVTNWPLSQTELCHKLSSVTNWPLSQTELCHKLTFVTNWPLSQTDLCHKLTSRLNTSRRVNYKITWLIRPVTTGYWAAWDRSTNRHHQQQRP